MSFYVPNTDVMPLAHICIDVTSLIVSKAFYSKTLEPFGWKVLFEHPDFAGLGPGYLVLGLNERGDGVKDRTGRGGTHIAFEAPSKQAVIDWYDAVMKNGAEDNGKPGLRKHYSPSYFAAFAYDPDGYRIEAVYHLSKEELEKE